MSKKKRTPAWIKRLSKNGFVDWLIIIIAALYIRMVWHSGRWERKLHPETAKLFTENKQIILAFWHGRLLMMPYIWPNHHEMHVLISEHSDGILISRISGTFGLKTISGSSSKGAIGAVKKIVRTLKAGNSVTFTPDGPRGPYQKAASGVVSVAAMTGFPIVPSTFSSSPAKIFKSWDRFMMPYPFGRGIIMGGEPFYIKKEGFDEDLLCIELETRMNNLQRQADNIVGTC